ncbi:MAG: hypothetical protein HQK49_19875 [Oligoflexia bacterium]|nr:hypothetical protein [Oligoflexia bacterium]
MKCKIGYLCSEKSLLVNSANTINTTNTTNTTSTATTASLVNNTWAKVPVSDIKGENLNILLFNSELQSEDVAHILEEESKYYPVWPGHHLGIKNEDDFDNFSKADKSESSENAILDLYSKWILCNNIKLLDNFFPIVENLRSLLENDRTNFFEELWQILKANLGTTYMRIVYHDLLAKDRDEKTNPNHPNNPTGPNEHDNPNENENNNNTSTSNSSSRERTSEQVKRLITMLVEGERKPITSDGKELEKHLLSIYGNKCHSNFHTPEVSLEKGEFLSLGLIRKTPVIILWRSFVYNKLQQSLVKHLFDALEYDFS